METLILFVILHGNFDDAIFDWSAQGHIATYVYRVDQTRNVTPNAVICYCTPRQALAMLLAGTGLRDEYTEDGMIVIAKFDGFCRPEEGAHAPLPPCLMRNNDNANGKLTTGRVEGHLGSGPDRRDKQRRTAIDETVRSPVLRYDNRQAHN